MHKLSTLIQNNEKEINEGFKLGKNAVKTNHQYSVIPTDKKELNEILKERLAKDKDADLNDIDVSNITDMSNIFKWLDPHNIDISEWDVSSVKDMHSMFYMCKNLNCDLSNWDMSNVKNINAMFYGCESFEGKGLENWDISSCQTSINTFTKCYKLNIDLSTWNVSNIVEISSMFLDCINFEGKGLKKWDMTNITRSVCAFCGCKNFNGNGLENWKFPKLKVAREMFNGCENFNCDVSNWDMSDCSDISRMFYNCKKFKGEGLDKWNIQPKVKKTLAFAKCVYLKNKPSWYKG